MELVDRIGSLEDSADPLVDLRSRVSALGVSGGSAEDVLDSAIHAVKGIVPLLVEDLVDGSGPERSVIATRAVGAIQAVAKLSRERRELGVGELDLSSPGFQMVFRWFLDIVLSVSKGVLSAGESDRFVGELAKRLAGWESRAVSELGADAKSVGVLLK